MLRHRRVAISFGPLVLMAALQLGGCGDEPRSRRDTRVGTLPCIRGVHVDVWTFDASPGQRVDITVDTVRAVTAADFAMFGICGEQFFEGHDERPCSFGAFGCPTTSFVVERPGACHVEVLFDDLSLITETHLPPCQDARRADYRLDVRIDGVSRFPTLTTDSLPPPPILTDLEDVTPCTAGRIDTWRFEVSVGQVVVVAADTSDADTAADLALDVVCNDDQLLLVRDDDFPCSFPPPKFKCPLGSFVAPADGSCVATIRSLGSCADTRTSRYRVGVERDGQAASLRLTEDDATRAIAVPTFSDLEDLIPCAAGIFDSWRFDVVRGDLVVIGVDTADQRTAADLVINVSCDDRLTLVAANERTCTFSPPAFACALGSFTAPADASCIVNVHSSGSCADPTVATYRLGVSRDSSSARPTLIIDDFASVVLSTSRRYGLASGTHLLNSGLRTPLAALTDFVETANAGRQ